MVCELALGDICQSGGSHHSSHGHTTTLEQGLYTHGGYCTGGGERAEVVVTCKDPHPHNSHHCNHGLGDGGGDDEA